MKAKANVSTNSIVKIVLSISVARMLHIYQKVAETEILLVGKTQIENNSIIVEEAVLLPQEANRSFVELDQETYADWIATVPDEDLSRYNCWLHTHPGMGVFWSGIDDKNIARQDMPLLVSIVADGSSMLGRIDLKEPFPVTIHHVPVEIGFDINEEVYEQARADIKENIHTHLAVSHGNKWPYGGREDSLTGWDFIPEDEWDEETSHDHDRVFEEYIMYEQYREEDPEDEGELPETTGYHRS